MDLDPEFHVARFNAGLTHQQLGNLATATNHYSRLVQAVKSFASVSRGKEGRARRP
jgi:hypothetical protein